VTNPPWSPVIGRFPDGIDATAKTDINSGTATVYHAPDCTPQEFGPGSTFVDQGNDPHLVRNNSDSVTADLYVVSFVPAGFGRRIDQPNPNPSICPN
jgi:hypothetical protein